MPPRAVRRPRPERAAGPGAGGGRHRRRAVLGARRHDRRSQRAEGQGVSSRPTRTDSGPGVAEQRLEDLDRDGVVATVVYGPPFGLEFIDDRDVRAECLRAYNDWADEFNAVDRDRLAVLAMLPVHTPGGRGRRVAAHRRARASRRGVRLLRSAEVPPFEDEWDEFWAVANDVALPIHFHLSGGMHSIAFIDWQRPAAVTVSPMQLDEALVGMLFSGIFERYPHVRLVLGESGLGWMPYLIDRMDHEFHKYREATEGRLTKPPSEYFRRSRVPHLRGGQHRSRVPRPHRRRQRDVGVGLSRTATARGRTPARPSPSRVLGTLDPDDAPQDRVRQRRPALWVPAYDRVWTIVGP